MSRAVFDSHAEFVAALEKRRAFSKQIKENENHLSSLSSALVKGRREIQEANQRIGGLRNNRQLREEAEAEITRLRSENSRIEGDMQSIRSENAQLVTEIGGIDLPVSLSVAAAHQEALSRKKERVKDLEAAIADQRNKSTGTGEVAETIIHLRERRADILAGIIEGDKTTEDLALFDEESAKTTVQAESDISARERILDEVGQTLEGLHLRLLSAKDELSTLEDITPEVRRALLLGISIDQTEKFEEAAAVAANALVELAAVNQLIGSDLRTNLSFNLHIPKLGSRDDAYLTFAELSPDSPLIVGAISKMRESFHEKSIRLI